MSEHKRGIWGMYCFNGLSEQQQHRVVEWGNLPFGYKPEGPCTRPAEVEITTIWDKTPGPRFYCRQCGAAYLMEGDPEGREQERIRLALEAVQHAMTVEEYERLIGW